MGQMVQTPFRDKGLVREDILEEVPSGGREHVTRQSRRQGWCRKGACHRQECGGRPYQGMNWLEEGVRGGALHPGLVRKGVRDHLY